MATVPVVSTPHLGSWGLIRLQGRYQQNSPPVQATGQGVAPRRGPTGATAPSSGSGVCKIQCLLGAPDYVSASLGPAVG